MKKALLVLLALAVMGSAAFAEVNVSAYGLGLWNVAANGEDGIESSLASKWVGIAAPYMGMTFSGSSDNVRFRMGMTAYGSSLSLGSTSYIEMRPLDWIAIAMGKFDLDETEKGAGFGSYNWYRIGSVRSADNGNFIFPSLLDTAGVLNDGADSRVTSGGTVVGTGGMNARFYPIKGLTVGFQVPLNYAVTTETRTDIAAVWGNANAYVRYDIDGIGTVRLGWDGRTKTGTGSPSDFEDVDFSDWWGIIAAAFELNLAALPELYVGVGARIPTKPVSESFITTDGGRPYEANVYAKYNLDIVTPLTFHALFGSKIMEENVDNSTYDNFGFYAGVGVDCEVLENVTVFADVRYADSIYMNRTKASDDDNITFGVGISRTFTNGNIGIAFVGSTNGYGNGNGNTSSGYAPHRTYSYTTGWSAGSCSKEFVWAIPVKFEMMF